jgi:quercetin dioxygenase-like cupin family protein
VAIWSRVQLLGCCAAILGAACARSRPARAAEMGTDGPGPARPAVIASTEGEARFLRGRKPILIKVDPLTVGSRHLFVGTERVPPGDSLGRHHHLHEEEILFLHRGVLDVTLAGQTSRASEGAVVFIPQATHIAARNPGPDTAEIVYVFNEPAFALCMRAFSSPAGQPYVEPSPDSRNAVLIACHMRDPAAAAGAPPRR